MENFWIIWRCFFLRTLVSRSVSLRCFLGVVLVILGGASPLFAENARPDERLTLKVVLQGANIAASDRLVEELLPKLLEDTNTGFVLTRDSKRLFEIYFDTPELTFLKRNGYIFYQAEEYFTKKKKKKKYHERVVYNAGSSEILEFEVRHYSKMQSGEGKHPLFSLVKRKQRPDFLAALNRDGVEYPLRLKSIFQVAENTQSYVLSKDSMELLSIQKSYLTGMRAKSGTSFGLIVVNINQGHMDGFATKPQKLIREFLVQLEEQGIRTSPDDNDYKIIFKQMEQKIMFFHLLLLYPGLVNFLYAIAIGCVGVLLIILFFRERA